ncbi:hypothetical protein C1645_815126 [Glomus cerebriforme]|uniref:Uncharacterized protein n=1 Tax=Glomus cerebriforme TaxID=658196 RepID=A0A397TGX4_9GLOM|nr:hypothetical protein C1645_815126 [Glomus cerebriforme]
MRYKELPNEFTNWTLRIAGEQIGLKGILGNKSDLKNLLDELMNWTSRNYRLKNKIRLKGVRLLTWKQIGLKGFAGQIHEPDFKELPTKEQDLKGLLTWEQIELKGE